VAGWRLGVRASTTEVDELLRRSLPHLVVAEPTRTPPPNYSILSGSTGVGAVETLSTLFQGCTPVLRSRSLPRLVHALAGQLEDWRRPLRDDVVVFSGLAVVRPDGGAASVLPRSARHLLPSLPQLLERHGVLVVDGTLVQISADGRLVVDDVQFGENDAHADGESGAPPGRYEIATWWSTGTPTKGEALVEALRRSRNLGHLGTFDAAEAIAHALERATVRTLRSTSRADAGSVAAQVADDLRGWA
jgi:hypothetical protein